MSVRDNEKRLAHHKRLWFLTEMSGLWLNVGSAGSNSRKYFSAHTAVLGSFERLLLGVPFIHACHGEMNCEPMDS
jgi:hypothetical protein